MKQLHYILKIILLLTIAAPIVVYAGTSGPSPIPPAPNFKVTTNTLMLCKGVTNYVPITVTNQGGTNYPTMQDVQISLSNRYITETGNSTVINNIRSDESSIVNIPVFVDLNASSLITVQVPITYSYLTLYQDSEVRNLTFDTLYCPSATQLVVNVSPTVLVSGEINNFTITFTNTGNTVLNNLSAQTYVSGSQSGIQILNHKPINIESILPLSSVNVTQRIYENGSQIFPLNVSVTYFSGSSLEQVVDSVSMLSSGTIDMVPSSISVTPSTITPGSILSISFVITDTGTSGVTDAVATAIPPAGFKPYGVSGTDFIGSIGTETPTAVSLTLIANASLKSGSYTIPVQLSYLNTFRQNMSTTVNVPVTVLESGSSSRETSSSNGSSTQNGSFGVYILIGTFAAIIIAIFSIALVKRRNSTA